MPFTVDIFDDRVRFTSISPSQVFTFQRGNYSADWQKDVIEISGSSKGPRDFFLNEIKQIGAINDLTTGGAGVVPPQNTLKEFYDFVEPFFFRNIGSGTPVVSPETFVGYSGDTTDGSVTEIFVDGVDLSRTLVPEDAQIAFELFITGKQTGGTSGDVGDSVTFKVEGEIKNIGGVVTINNVTTFTISQSTPTENWEVQVRANDTEDAIRINVVGEADKDISWKGELRTINL